jgi:uncharacterized membrane protein YdbT with pleckstrin-like domain
MTIPPSTEQTVWQGRPSALVDLPFYLTLLVGAALASVAVLFLLPATEPSPDATSTANLFGWVLAALWIGCIALALGRWVVRRATRYVLTTERLRITTGVLSTVTEDIELRRVRDSSVARPFFLRLVGLGDVRLTSADSTAPRVTLHAVRDPDRLQETIRHLVEGLIRRHGVREIDLM